jgi:hypothetical protein
MGKAIITPDQDALISEVEIAAPLDRVFTREQALQWGKSDAFQVTRWGMEARPGFLEQQSVFIEGALS